MYIFTYTCCIIQYYLILITRGKVLILQFLINECTVCFSRNKHKPYHSYSLRNDINSVLIYKSSPRVYCYAVSPWLMCCFAYDQTRLQSNWKIAGQPGDIIEMLLIVRIKQELHSWFFFLYILKIQIFLWLFLRTWDYRVKRLKHSTSRRKDVPITLRSNSK